MIPERDTIQLFFKICILCLFYVVPMASFSVDLEFVDGAPAMQDTFPAIFIDTTETFEQVDFTADPGMAVDSINPASSVDEFEKRINASSGKKHPKKIKADRRSTPFIVNGEVVASHVDQKTKKERDRLWKEIDPADQIRRQMENNQILLGRYEKNKRVAISIKNDRLVEAMDRKIEYTKKRIKEQKKALRKIK